VVVVAVLGELAVADPRAAGATMQAIWGALPLLEAN
jgi:hypothetical protein